MIEDELIIMEAPELRENISYDEVVNFLRDKRPEIESRFPNDEYLKLDLTHGEIIGLKSTAVIQGIPICDLAAIDWVIRHDEKYKSANMLNLGNVKMIYETFEG